jgi:hypothetical protein
MKHHFIKIGLHFSFALIIAISFSCVTTKTLKIEIPVESKKELPKAIQSLTLVNRSIDSSFSDHETDSLQKIFYKNNFKYDTIINDIQAVDTCLKALGDLLFESGRYDVVIPEDRFLKFEKNSFLTQEMPWNEVNNLCTTYHTDAVLSIDHFKTRVSTKFDKEAFYDPLSDSFSEASSAQIAVYYEVLFRVYDPANEKIHVREFIRDTLVWEDADLSTKALFNRFTSIKSALSQAGIAVSLDFTELISTVWRDEKRQYFSKGDAELKHASLFIEDNNWKSAMAIWKNLAENSKSKTIRSKAEFNLAIGYELEGNIEQAILWALKSYKTMYRIVTYEYLEVLERRKNELKKQKR